MSAPAPRTVAAPNLVDAPLYTLCDVAHYLHIPFWAAHELTGRGRSHIQTAESRISFRQFAEMFVRMVVLHGLAALKPDEVWTQEKLHEAIQSTLGDRGKELNWFGQRTIRKAIDHLLEPFANRLGKQSLTRARRYLTSCLDRVEMIEGSPCHVAPFSRTPVESSPRIIVLDPRIRFGRPTIVGRGTPTDMLFERYQAGDSVAELAEDYDITTAEVEEAIRFETAPPAPLFPSCDG